MCDLLEVRGSGEADIIHAAHKKKAVKGHSVFFPLFFMSLFLLFLYSLLLPPLNFVLTDKMAG